ncbi:MAG: LysR family transcriptional regulator [Desulfobacterales bacterium]|nr:LysR family transcriptional regulator [Desulfobacterales bacterium]
MELRLLRYFVAVYEEKSITAASRRCYISQPSLSNAIKQLEEMLGVALFARHKKGVNLTDEAHHLYPSAKKLLKDARELTSLFTEEQAPVQLKLGLFPDLSPMQLKETLAKMRRVSFSLQLEVVDHDAPSDARLTLDLFKKEDELFTPLWEEDYLVCLPETHPLVSVSSITGEMLHAHPFIECPPCEAHQQTMGILAGEGMKLNISTRAEHKGQVLQLIQAGFGISFLPEGVAEYGQGVVTRPFDGPRMFRRIGICYPSARDSSRVIRDVLKQMVA